MKSMLFTLALVFSNSVAWASELTIDTSEHSSGVSFHAKNNYFSPVTVKFAVDADNMEGAVNDFIVIPARSSELLFELTRQDKRKRWQYAYEYKYQLGDFNAQQSEHAAYNLPFEEGSIVKGGQGFNGAFSHQGIASFAVDFPAPEGTPVYPARDGLVIKVVEKYSKAGTDEQYKPLGNAVWILHEDGTIGVYLHFKHNGVQVESGQKVGRATVIGLSGNTGYSSGPHLHFEVSTPNEDLELQSHEFFFTSKKGKEFTVVKRKKYSVDR